MIERNERGLWVRGSASPNPAGRPPRMVEANYLDATLSNCTLSDWAEIVRVAVEDAKTGNVAARRYSREWLGRIFIPSIERILIASFSANIDVSDSRAQLDKLIAMLVGSDIP